MRSLASPRAPASHWRGAIDRAIEALASAGLVTVAPAGLQASEAGIAAAAAFLGVQGDLPRSWQQACDVWLIARALGWQRAPARRSRRWKHLEGLRAAILAHAYGVQIKGAATPAQLRRALADAALKSAFGEGAAGLAGKLGLSARASRLLAAQLLSKPRDFGTDGQLVAALAAQSVGAAAADLASLRRAVLRQFLAASERPARARRAPRKLAPAKEDPARPVRCLRSRRPLPEPAAIVPPEPAQAPAAPAGAGPARARA